MVSYGSIPLQPELPYSLGVETGGEHELTDELKNQFGNHASRTALATLIEVEASEFTDPERYLHPLSVTEMKQARMHTQLTTGVRYSEAYEDIGGDGLDKYGRAARLNDMWGPFIDDYEPGKSDISEAFERFDLINLSPAVIYKMTVADRKILADSFMSFTGRLKSRKGILGVRGGDAACDVAQRYYKDYITTDAQAGTYARELGVFHDTILSSDTYQVLKGISGSKDADRLRREKAVRAERASHLIPIVSYDTKHKKYCIRPVGEMAIAA